MLWPLNEILAYSFAARFKHYFNENFLCAWSVGTHALCISQNIHYSFYYIRIGALGYVQVYNFTYLNIKLKLITLFLTDRTQILKHPHVLSTYEYVHI